MAATQGLTLLEAAVIAVTLHPYDYDPSADAVGLAAARALELASGLTLKTLMVEVGGRPVGIAQAMAMAVLGARAAALIA